jgi:hypothetical protein
VGAATAPPWWGWARTRHRPRLADLCLVDKASGERHGTALGRIRRRRCWSRSPWQAARARARARARECEAGFRGLAPFLPSVSRAPPERSGECDGSLGGFGRGGLGRDHLLCHASRGERQRSGGGGDRLTGWARHSRFPCVGPGWPRRAAGGAKLLGRLEEGWSSVVTGDLLPFLLGVVDANFEL